MGRRLWLFVYFAPSDMDGNPPEYHIYTPHQVSINSFVLVHLVTLTKLQILGRRDWVMSEQAKIIYFPTPKVESQDQLDYWWDELEKAERRAEDIRRVLGILGVERGLDDGDGAA